jgi:hypothetical protein
VCPFRSFLGFVSPELYFHRLHPTQGWATLSLLLEDIDVGKALTNCDTAANVEVTNQLGATLAVLDLAVDNVSGLMKIVLGESGHDSSLASRTRDVGF